MGVVDTENELFVQVRHELEQMESYVQSHGGQIELVTIVGYEISVRLKGACDTCPLSFYTITFGLEQRLHKAIHPSVRVIIVD